MTSEVDVETGLQEVLRTWAHAQSPETDFSGWRMASVLRPMRLRDGPFFAPGELLLVRAAERQVSALRAWSFDLQGEVFIPLALVQFETEAPPPEPELHAPAAAAVP